MSVSLNASFGKELESMRRDLAATGTAIKADLVKAHHRIGQAHRSEAVKRVPVDSSNLKQKILTRTHVNGSQVLTETGTNVKEYPVYLEFGTRFIAQGRVLRLGDSPELTDSQAVRNWPAKNGEIVNEKSGQANQKAAAASQRRFERGGADEQMPWLRPAWSAVKDFAMAELKKVHKDNTNRGRKAR